MPNSKIIEITDRIESRSQLTRKAYLKHIDEQAKLGRSRNMLACSNLAHAVAGIEDNAQKNEIIHGKGCNVGIVSAYNDMLSAHCPYANYPQKIKKYLQEIGSQALVAGCVPAMCDGVTQGQVGMDMSLFSRDVIAQGVAISLSHNVFDAALLLGICDKVAPGMLMGAATFGHLPMAFVPSGPMPSGISNDEKTKIRQQFAAGEIDKVGLQDMENKSYHCQGTCTFYGTANTNQLVLEAMGLMLPGSAFVPYNSPLREALTKDISRRIVEQSIVGNKVKTLADVVCAKNFVNALVALLASGGSTNLTLHLVAMAKAFGYEITWDDFSDISDIVPLLLNIYPNNKPDINAFERAGGVPVLLNSLNNKGLLHTDIKTATGSFEDQLTVPVLKGDTLVYESAPETRDPTVLKSDGSVFQEQGGIKVLDGNLGRSVIKISAVAKEHHHIVAPARVFDSQHDVEKAYKAGDLECDAIIVVRYAGPAASGMPELHKLMPVLGNMQKKGYKVALITDGRLSGASGKIPSAIHMCPEALRGGALALLQDGDMIDFNAAEGYVNCLEDLSKRTAKDFDSESDQQTFGRNLFAICRENVGDAEQGASFLFK